mgnify:CR=1 FL=1
MWGLFVLFSVCFVNSLQFQLNLLGLALVWLGLALFMFCKTTVFSNESARFGLGLGWFGNGWTSVRNELSDLFP